ncbi:GNAT family N-acetyltransferase [Ornithinibacillus halotolerans]|uniref:N-acetyltransferase n=1 Tax=Ornithinibacillus halotolerans TaxID=1274357 RepID=A0A916WCE5_9BACI|nr:GNAT family N-acetyltransferase [Ornithinibacillus halotolerans]GGA85149.1 N-acetyltransferase [Ornithinibacillus halotolerans]
MEINTERLKLLPCTEELMTSVTYELRPHIKMHLQDLLIDSSLLGWGPWLIIEKKSDQIIGDIGFKGKPTLNNTVEIGYAVVPVAQNNGFATEVAQAIVDWAFTHDDVDMVIAECLEDNIASIKVLKKLGMTVVGVEKQMLKWQLHKHV